MEIFLQVVDVSVGYWRLAQKTKEQASNSKVILCIGDSTTAVGLDGSYPYLLQQKLDQMYGKKTYKVVNAGVPGITTSGILVGLDEKIKVYRPDYVITLLGVNDVLLYDGKNSITKGIKILSYLKSLSESLFNSGNQFDFDIHSELYSNNLIKDLKTSVEEVDAESAYKRQDYELAEALYKALPTTHVPSESMLWNLAIMSSAAGRREETHKYFQKLAEIRDDAKVNYSIGWYYINHYASPAPEVEYAIKFARRALELDPTNLRTLHFMGQIYKNELKQLTDAENFYYKANSLKRCNLGVTVGLSDLLQKQNKNSQAIEVLEECVESHDIGDFDLLRRLINLYLKENRLEDAKKTILAAKARYPDYVMFSLLEKRVFKSSTVNASWNFLENEITIKNYQKIAKVISEYNIKHIVMQYPLQDIQPLKSILKSFDKVTYVSNEDNYKQLLSKHDYSEVFLDQVTDDFGHSTKFGNEALVRRLIETLLAEKVLPEKI